MLSAFGAFGSPSLGVSLRAQLDDGLAVRAGLYDKLVQPGESKPVDPSLHDLRTSLSLLKAKRSPRDLGRKPAAAPDERGCVGYSGPASPESAPESTGWAPGGEQVGSEMRGEPR